MDDIDSANAKLAPDPKFERPESRERHRDVGLVIQGDNPAALGEVRSNTADE